MKIAFDQALNCTGYSIFDSESSLVEYGKFTTDPKSMTGEKLLQIREFLADIIEQKNPSNIAFEEIQLQENMPGGDNFRNVKTFKKLAYVQAIFLEVCVQNDIDFEIVPSSAWKSTCKVYGRNRKEQKAGAKEYVQDRFGIDVIQDICDSICIGVHAFQNKSINEEEINWE